jgi:sigma-B regulation protein RsbU (phosphoserine phosphatase)
MDEELAFGILQNSPIGYCIISKDLKLLFINHKLLKYLDVKPGQIAIKKWIDTIIEKNYLNSKRRVIIRWLRIKFNSISTENKFVIKIFDDLRLDFFVQIDVFGNIPDSAQNSSLISSKNRLVTIYPVSGTILLHQSRLTHKLSAEYQIAGKIQKNINNYIMDMIEGRYFKYHFKRLFMPSGILSGDIVNIKPVSRRYSSVFLGDGRGHGLPAALYSALIHSYLNMMASEINHGMSSTAKLLRQINKYAYRDFSETGEFYFFSGVYGLIDGNTRDFCITNAGHPYPVFIRDGEVTRLESNGPLVGIDQDSVYSEKKFELKNGDIILFFTDGIYDIIAGENDSDHDAITAIIRKHLNDNKMDTSGVFTFLIETIQSFKSRLGINDDITILQMLVEEK